MASPSLEDSECCQQAVGFAQRVYFTAPFPVEPEFAYYAHHREIGHDVRGDRQHES